MFTAAEEAACRQLVQWALAEDFDEKGDLTSQAIIPADRPGRAAFTARTAGVCAGLPAVEFVLEAVDRRLQLNSLVRDGAPLVPGTQLAIVSGSMREILAGERTALNFLQRLSGVATLTRRYVDAVAGLPCRILDTRKTTPGWRLLEKYAVRCGGGHNHRMGLYDGILIKDNHLECMGSGPKAIGSAVAAARAAASAVSIEIEVDNLDEFEAALAARPDIVLLDNMPADRLCEAVRLRDAVAPQVLLEASGGVNLSTVRALGETGVDRISVGALTHSAPALDIALDYLPA